MNLVKLFVRFTQINFVTNKELKEIRKLAKLSQREFAVLVNVNRTSIANWEIGRHKIPPLAAEKIFNLFIKKDSALTERGATLYKTGGQLPEGEIIGDLALKYLDPKRAKLICEVQKLALDSTTDDRVIEALLKNIEAFRLVPAKQEKKE